MGGAEIFRGGSRLGILTRTTHQILPAGDRLGVPTNSRVRLLVAGRSAVSLRSGALIETFPPTAIASSGRTCTRSTST